MSEDIVLLKLRSGEEIVARVEEENNHHFRLHHIRAMMMQPGPQGQMNVALVPWSAGSPDGTFEVPKSTIAGRAIEVPKQLEDGYLSQTSGIQIANNVPPAANN